MNKKVSTTFALISIIIISLTAGAHVNLAKAQTPKSDWTMVYTGIGDWAWINSAVQTADGGYILAGANGTRGVIFNHTLYPSESDPLLAKTNSTGVLEWAKTYTAGTGDTVFNSVVQTNDLGFAAYSSDGFLWKIDNSGSVQWEKQIFRNPTQAKLEVTQTNDEGYLLAGGAYVFKADPNGNVSWNYTLPDVANDGINDILVDNGTYVAVGYEQVLENATTAYAGWFGKLSLSGQLLINQSYQQPSKMSTGFEDVIFNAISKTSDGAYIVAGHTSGEDTMWLYRLGTLGAVEWAKLYENYKFGFFVSAIDLENNEYAAFAYQRMSLIDSSGNQKWNGTYDDLTGTSNSGFESPLLNANWGLRADNGEFVVAGMKDVNDNYRYPWLAKFSIESPSPSATPLPSVPEFPTWIVLPLVLAATLATFAFAKRKRRLQNKS